MTIGQIEEINHMNRKDKIDKLVKIFNENKIIIVDNERIGDVVINADFFLDEICNKLIEEEFSNYDVINLNLFLGDNLIMVKIDNILWISFEHCMFPLEALYETEIFEL
jgi:hypothetical protein